MKKNASIADLVAQDMSELLEKSEFQSIFKTAAKKEKKEEKPAKGKKPKSGKCKCPPFCKCVEKHGKDVCECPKGKKPKASKKAERLNLAINGLNKIGEVLDELGLSKSAAGTIRVMERLISEAQENVEDFVEKLDLSDEESDFGDEDVFDEDLSSSPFESSPLGDSDGDEFEDSDEDLDIPNPSRFSDEMLSSSDDNLVLDAGDEIDVTSLINAADSDELVVLNRILEKVKLSPSKYDAKSEMSGEPMQLTANRKKRAQTEELVSPDETVRLNQGMVPTRLPDRLKRRLQPAPVPRPVQPGVRGPGVWPFESVTPNRSAVRDKSDPGSLLTEIDPAVMEALNQEQSGLAKKQRWFGGKLMPEKSMTEYERQRLLTKKNLVGTDSSNVDDDNDAGVPSMTSPEQTRGLGWEKPNAVSPDKYRGPGFRREKPKYDKTVDNVDKSQEDLMSLVSGSREEAILRAFAKAKAKGLDPKAKNLKDPKNLKNLKNKDDKKKNEKKPGKG